MARWTAPDGVGIEYEVHGSGPAVLLLHGFASSARINWMRPGIVDALVAAGFKAVAYDARGHGRSDAPHDPAAYGDNAMVKDAVGLIGHLGLDDLAVVGYSMGSQVAASVVPEEPRVRRVVLGGIGSRLLAPMAGEERYPARAIADALEAERLAEDTAPTPRAFRAFADATKADRQALAAVQRTRVVEGHPDLQSIAVPVLLVVGDRDTLIGDAEAVVRALPDARLVVVPGAISRPSSHPPLPRRSWGSWPSPEGLPAPTDPLAALEAFRSGRYAEFLIEEGGEVPGWAWVNTLAHGNVLDIASVAVAGPSPRGLAEEHRPWLRARSAMAQAVMRLTVRQGHRLKDVQNAVLLGVELELAATAGWFERGPVETTALVLESLEASTPRA